MSETESALVEMGLTSTEAKMYLAGLSTDGLTIAELAKKTGVKRPTAYHAIGTLSEKGLAVEKKTMNKSYFTMSAPENIRGLFERQKEALERRSEKLDDLIPILAQQKKSDTTKDSVSVVQYTGIEGMKIVLDIAFYCKSRRWDIIAPFDNFLREYDKEYAGRYLNARKLHGITSRALWEERASSGRPLTASEIKDRNPRIMPKAMHGKFKSMIILFDDKLAIFSSYDQLSAVLITSTEIHEMFLTLFEGIWDTSKPYGKK